MEQSVQSEPSVAQPDKIYATESVLNFGFADNVSVTSYPRGMFISFSKMHPTEKKLIVTSEVLMPWEVAIIFARIVSKQITELMESGQLVMQENEGQK